MMPAYGLSTTSTVSAGLSNQAQQEEYVASRIEDYAIVGDMQSVALICTEHWRAPGVPADERWSVPGWEQPDSQLVKDPDC
jgi:hypothetical protein